MDNTMKNMKVLHYCWTCGKAHELPDVPYNYMVEDQSVMCECGGHVVSRSGKVQLSIVPMLPVFKVDDGELHWFSAKDEQEARAYYNKLYEEELEPDAVIEEVTGSELDKRNIRSDDDIRGLQSLKDVIREQNEFPALLASSVW